MDAFRPHVFQMKTFNRKQPDKSSTEFLRAIPMRQRHIRNLLLDNHDLGGGFFLNYSNELLKQWLPQKILVYRRVPI